MLGEKKENDREKRTQSRRKKLKMEKDLKNLKEIFKLKTPQGLKIIEPVGYLEFLQLQKNAKIILTDSGGIQEEACILKIPCITLRENTERPETINVGSNVLVGTNKNLIINEFEKMICKKKNWKNPFGNGESSKKILDTIQS